MSSQVWTAPEFPEHLKLAMTYAEESSKRARWVVFILQLAVVLVVASLWLQSDLYWLSFRLTTAQHAVRLLTCQMESQSLPPASREDTYDASRCKTEPLSAQETKQAQQYLKQWGFSLAEAKKNVTDLQQLMNSRVMGIGVPVLGIVFDVNDLSVVGGITFCILLSWFNFTLLRQHENVKRVFQMAEESGKGTLDKAYRLLAMTQVLSIPPGSTRDSRNVSVLRRWSRLPNLIIWTAAVAELFVLIDDFVTMAKGDVLSPLVSHAETALALYMFIYVFYRSIKCFQLITQTGWEWVAAWNKFCPEDEKITMDRGQEQAAGQTEPKPQSMQKPSRQIYLGLALLATAVVVHLIDDWRPGVLQKFGELAGSFASFCKGHLSFFWSLGYWLPFVILLVMILFLILYVPGGHLRTSIRLAWLLLGLALADVVIHNLKAVQVASTFEFTRFMEGFFSSPMVAISALVFLLLMKGTDTSKETSGEGPAVGKAGAKGAAVSSRAVDSTSSLQR